MWMYTVRSSERKWTEVFSYMDAQLALTWYEVADPHTTYWIEEVWYED